MKRISSFQGWWLGGNTYEGNKSFGVLQVYLVFRCAGSKVYAEAFDIVLFHNSWVVVTNVKYWLLVLSVNVRSVQAPFSGRVGINTVEMVVSPPFLRKVVKNSLTKRVSVIIEGMFKNWKKNMKETCQGHCLKNHN